MHVSKGPNVYGYAYDDAAAGQQVCFALVVSPFLPLVRGFCRWMLVCTTEHRHPGWSSSVPFGDHLHLEHRLPDRA